MGLGNRMLFQNKTIAMTDNGVTPQRVQRGTLQVAAELDALITNEILPGTDGLVHISELDTKRVAKTEDICVEGDEMVVKVIRIDREGKIRLSRKEAIKARLDLGVGEEGGDVVVVVVAGVDPQVVLRQPELGGPLEGHGVGIVTPADGSVDVAVGGPAPAELRAAAGDPRRGRRHTVGAAAACRR